MKIHYLKRTPLSKSNIFDQNFMKLYHYYSGINWTLNVAMVTKWPSKYAKNRKIGIFGANLRDLTEKLT